MPDPTDCKPMCEKPPFEPMGSFADTASAVKDSAASSVTLTPPSTSEAAE